MACVLSAEEETLLKYFPLYEEYVFNAYAAVIDTVREMLTPEQLVRLDEYQRLYTLQTFSEWLDGERYCRERVVSYLKRLCCCSIPEEDDDEVHGAEKDLRAADGQAE